MATTSSAIASKFGSVGSAGSTSSGEENSSGIRGLIIGGGMAVVLTRIASVQLVEGVEILFRRESGEYLIVTKRGRIIVRS